VQLDEAFGCAKRRANVKDARQDIWLWIASDVKTKLIPVMRVGGRNQEVAFAVVHELKGRLATGE
jgi:IS1 family transposase